MDIVDDIGANRLLATRRTSCDLIQGSLLTMLSQTTIHPNTDFYCVSSLARWAW